jgi:hypothetical protein
MHAYTYSSSGGAAKHEDQHLTRVRDSTWLPAYKSVLPFTAYMWRETTVDTVGTG